MEIPENLHALVDQLGQAIVQALVNDPQSRELAKQIQAAGFDIALLLEATVALRQREEGHERVEETLSSEQVELRRESEHESTTRAYLLRDSAADSVAPSAIPEWSEADKAFLKTFKISLE
jgi:predicted transcriptional regulator